MFNILIVEDDKSVGKLMKSVLNDEGYNCTLAQNGKTALDIMDKQKIDLAVVDIMMPVMNGYEFTQTLRQGGCDIPILMVTAKISHEDKKKGFALGIDDFLAKPFDTDELLWRVKALARRSKIASEKKLILGSTELDYNSFGVSVDGKAVSVTPKEFLLLYKLLAYPNKLFTKRQIMDEIWSFDSESDEHTVEVHINRLREKFKDNTDFSIKTIRGFGYMGVLKNDEK